MITNILLVLHIKLAAIDIDDGCGMPRKTDAKPMQKYQFPDENGWFLRHFTRAYWCV